MPFTIVRNDITRMEVDAIVNAANKSLLGGGGVDGAIHRAAGPELLQECRKIGGISSGEAVVTGGYNLPAKYVIHTVGPIWYGGLFGEEKTLRSCYRESLKRAEEKGCRSVAFPLISAGAYRYPREKALDVAVGTIREYLSEKEDEPDIYLVIYDRESFRISSSHVRKIQSFIDDHYVESHPDPRRRREEGLSAASLPASMPYEEDLAENALPEAALPESVREDADEETSFGETVSFWQAAPKEEGITEQESLVHKPDGAAVSGAKPGAAFRKKAKTAKSADAFMAQMPSSAAFRPQASASKPAKAGSIDDWLKNLDESFTEMLLRKIDEKGMTDAQCYKKANIDRKLFSKIRLNPQYKPKKTTAIAFAIALELSLPETEELLKKAGYALSDSSIFDVIIRYFLTIGDYDIFTINEMLFQFDQVLLGA